MAELHHGRYDGEPLGMRDADMVAMQAFGGVPRGEQPVGKVRQNVGQTRSSASEGDDMGVAVFISHIRDRRFAARTCVRPQA